MAEQNLEQSLFLHAIALASPAQRAQYLDESCRGNLSLRAELDALLAAHDRLGAASAPRTAPTDFSIPPTEPGTVLGPYKLLQQIGEGGMGVVYMAEQREPVQRRVALKIIKPGMDTRQVIARFEAERQALAMMDHPNIAKVFDAGTTRNEPGGVSPASPYFVMELVHGIPITKYCDDHHLTLKHRLELFLPVCQAIQHAHQKGIIHRDLKPSNVLVAEYDNQPVPKVIDFGVAKATAQRLTERTMFTELGQLVGTLEYMSPEQAKLNQLDIDTRSDIYSLGVLLYELLTGATPFDRKQLQTAAFDEMLRIIREEDPPRPSTRLSSSDTLPAVAANRGIEPARLSRQVQGELDWIVMKCLEKDRGRRYETATGLAADLQRYLDDEPVQACPPSAWYRFRKFARRNTRALATSSVVALAVILVAGIAGWAAWDREARRATMFARTEQVLADSEAQYQQRKLPEATHLARNALALAESGAGDPKAARRASEWLKDLDMVARLEEIGPGSDRDDPMPIPVAYSQAFWEYGIDIEALTPEEAAARIASRPIRVDLATALDRWGNFVRRMSINLGDLGLDGEKGVALRDRLRRIARLADPNELRDQLRDLYAKDGPWDHQEIMGIADSVDLASTPIGTLMAIGDALDWPQQISFYTRVQQQHPNDFAVTYELGYKLFWSAVKGDGDLDSPIRYLTAAVAIRPRSRGALQLLAHSLRNKGCIDEAIAAYRAADRVLARPRHQVDIGGLLLKAEREQEAAAEFREALRLTADPTEVHVGIGRAYAEAGKYDDAIVAYREAIRVKADYAHGHHGLGTALGGNGLVDDAIAAHREAVRLKPDNSFFQHELGLALCRQGLHDEGLAALREAIRITPGNPDYHNMLGINLSKAGGRDEAITAFREAIRLKPEDSALHFNLGTDLVGKNELDAAIVAFREAIRLKPDNAPAHNWLGGVLQTKGLLDDAIAADREAVRLNPENPGFRITLGHALKTKGALIESIAAYSEAVQLAPNDADAHFELGVALQAKGLRDDAIAEYQETLRLQPDKAMAKHWLGTALQAKGQVDDAIEAHREAIRLQPDHAIFHWWLGTAVQAKGRVDDAVGEYREALRLQPDLALAHSSLASALDKKGLLNDAIAAYREAVRLKPDSPSLHYELGAVHARVGQWKPAAAAYSRGLELDKNPNNHGFWYSGLPLQLAAGDEEGYRRLCRQMLERFGQSQDLITAEWTAKTSALVPDAVPDFELVEKLADRIVIGTENHGSYRFFVLVKALVEYRAGRHAEAVQWAERYAPVPGGNEFDAFVFATLSMAQHRLGNADKASDALASAKAIVTGKMPDPANGRPFVAWREWLHADVALREAEALAKEK